MYQKHPADEIHMAYLQVEQGPGNTDDGHIPFTVDTPEKEAYGCTGKKITFGKRANRFLYELLQRPGKMVTDCELYEALETDDPGYLHNAVTEARKGVKDACPHSLTIPRHIDNGVQRGYKVVVNRVCKIITPTQTYWLYPDNTKEVIL